MDELFNVVGPGFDQIVTATTTAAVAIIGIALAVKGVAYVKGMILSEGESMSMGGGGVSYVSEGGGYVPDADDLAEEAYLNSLSPEEREFEMEWYDRRLNGDEGDQDAYWEARRSMGFD